jgi:hypothetical protein
LVTVKSDPIAFNGLSQDNEDMTGIGGASRTRYHDYNTGETYSDHFYGTLGDILVYNRKLDAPATKDVYTYLSNRYGIALTEGYYSKNQGDWKLFEQYDNTGVNTISTATPNPFIENTSFGLNLIDAQYITIDLYSSTGQKVKTIFAGSMKSGIYDFTIDGSGLSNGLYIYRVTGDNFTESGKVVLMK